MARFSHVLLETGDDAADVANPIGKPIKAAGFFGRSSGIYTVTHQLVDMEGKIFIEGALATNPADTDFFPIQLTDQPNLFVEYPLNPSLPTGINNVGDRGTFGYSFEINVIWLRARVDRTDFSDPLDPIHGAVSRILVNF